jgi:hypothetical protein
MTKIAGSGSVSQRQGSADPDPDPHQNVMDPQYRLYQMITLEEGGEEPPLVLRDDSLLQLERHILQHLARVVREV